MFHWPCIPPAAREFRAPSDAGAAPNISSDGAEIFAAALLEALPKPGSRWDANYPRWPANTDPPGAPFRCVPALPASTVAGCPGSAERAAQGLEPAHYGLAGESLGGTTCIPHKPFPDCATRGRNPPP